MRKRHNITATKMGYFKIHTTVGRHLCQPVLVTFLLPKLYLNMLFPLYKPLIQQV